MAPSKTSVPLESLMNTSCWTLASLLSNRRLKASPAGTLTDDCSKAMFRALIVTSAVPPLAAGAELGATEAPAGGLAGTSPLAVGEPPAPAEAAGAGVAAGGGAKVQ